MIQWHPLFAHLLRPVLQDYYDIETNVPVGDLPRQADILLIRRITSGKPPYQGLWRHLSRWNILEFKGRTESARVTDIDLLVEVGLGIHRRLEETKTSKVGISREDVSFWYLANHLGKRFLRDAERLLGVLEPSGPGLWRSHILARPIWLVSNRDVPVNGETVPVHLVSDESAGKEMEVAEIIISQPDWWATYAPWLATLHPNLWKEISDMVRRKGGAELDFSAVIEEIGVKNLAEQLGVKSFIELFGLPRVIDELGVDKLFEELTPAQREELKRRFQRKSN